MATNFPTSLDSLTNPTSSDTLASPDHAGQHANANDAIEALQAKVGVDGSAVTSSLDYKVTVNTPTGVIQMFCGSTAPTGWLLCDGSAISRTTYSALFAVMGTAYGVGDGSTTFNVPDMRSRVPIGSGQGSGLTNRARGASGGAESKTISTSNLPAHTHSADPPATNSGTVSSDHAHYTGAHGHSYITGNQAVSGTSRAIITATGGTPASGAIYNADAGWSGGISANHVHATDIGSFTTGDGGFANSAVDIMNPFLSVNFIVKW